VDVRFGPDNADAAASPGRINFNDAVDEAHPAAGIVSGRTEPTRRTTAETTGQIAIAQFVDCAAL